MRSWFTFGVLAALCVLSVSAVHYPRTRGAVYTDNAPSAPLYDDAAAAQSAQDEQVIVDGADMQFRDDPAAAAAAADPVQGGDDAPRNLVAPASTVVVTPPAAASVVLPPEPSLQDSPTAVTPDTPHDLGLSAELSPEERKQMEKLNEALGAIKHDIMAKVHQIDEEDKWVTEVKKIMEAYGEKVQRVEANVAKLRKEVQKLAHKKKQIDNLRLQTQLQSKLKTARSDLDTLEGDLETAEGTEREFLDKKKIAQKNINVLQKQLDKLRGIDSSSGEGEGDATSTGAGEEAL